MRCVVQRASRAQVTIEGTVKAKIGPGVVALVGVARDDDEARADWMARKIAGLRIFDDGQGRMGRSLVDTGGAVLCVSQFTLYGEVRKGTRPSFTGAAPAELAEHVYGRFCSVLREQGVDVQEGVFGARMKVELVNDGPVTLVIDR